MKPPQIHPRLAQILGLGAVFAAAIAVFWRGLGGGFIFDDYPNLVMDPSWRVTGWAVQEWLRALGSGIASDSGRPLAMLSFGLNHLLTGMDPWAMKLTNLVMHAFNACLVYLLARRLMALPGALAPGSAYAAALLAIAWAVHPLQVSTALYIVQRMEIGAATGTLLALLCYLQARTAATTPARRALWLAGAALATLAGLGFKESAALVPLYALALELFVLGFRDTQGHPLRPLKLAYGVMAGMGALAFLMLAPRYLSPEAYSIRHYSVGERLLTQLPVLWMYLKQSFLPLPHTLVFYYDHLPISRGLLSPPLTLVSGVILAALAGLAVALRRAAPLAALGIAWFFIAHTLTSNIFPLELAFEHRNYLALFGLLLAASQALQWAGRRMHWDARTVAAALPVGLIAVLGWMHAGQWANPTRLAITLASANPASERASYAMGRRLYEDSAGDPSSPAWSLAKQEFEHAASLPRSSPLPEHALIVMLGRAGQPIPVTLWDSFRQKMTGPTAAGPQHIHAVHGVLACRLKEGCQLDDEALFGTILAGVEANPRSAVLHAMYANFAWSVMQDRKLAVGLARMALELAPTDPDQQANLAKFLAAAPELAEAGELDRLVEGIRRANRGGRMDQELQEIEDLASQAVQAGDAEGEQGH